MLGLATAVALGAWTGTFSLTVNSTPVSASVQLSPRTAAVAFGPGHLSLLTVKATVRGSHVHFVVPGAPSSLVFDGMRVGRLLEGTVRQGTLRGTFRFHPGRSRVLPALGLYKSTAGSAVAIVKAEGLPTWLVELPSGRIHGLSAGLTTVGSRLGRTSGDGTLELAPNRVTWRRRNAATIYARVVVRQQEVRVGATAATLTLPTGRGPFPAVAMVHGSGPQTRQEFQVFAAYCELLGIGVLADDKRGVGQSQGTYPGESATPGTIDRLAKDAQAEVRFLAALPRVDRGRVGLLGDSQAGWIIALAAAREATVRWAVPLVGPTVTVGESDLWAGLAGGGQAPASASRTKMLHEVRKAGPGGFDPLPSLRKLKIPVHWVFADDDRNVPTELCIERLRDVRAGHDFSWSLIHATHTLLDVPGGLNAGLQSSRGFGSTLFSAVGAWLEAHHIVDRGAMPPKRCEGAATKRRGTHPQWLASRERTCGARAGS
jgi:pimeloyl-ACP methyl ester carboxylesterase